MPNFTRVLAQLRSERDRAERELERLDEAIRTIQHLNGTSRGGIRRAGRKMRSRTVSAAAQARMAAAQKARRAKENGRKVPKPRHMSAAARRRIAAAQKARWAKLRVQQGKEKKAAV